MAITLGTFTRLDDGVYAGTLRALNVTATLAIVPVERKSDKAPDHRSTRASATKSAPAGARSPSRAAKPTNLKIGAPEFGPTWLRCRLVKLEAPAEDGTTHIALWKPRDREGDRAPPRHFAAGLFRLFRLAAGKGRWCPLFSNQTRLAGIPSMSCRTGPPQRCCPQFCRAQGARCARRSSSALDKIGSCAASTSSAGARRSGAMRRCCSNSPTGEIPPGRRVSGPSPRLPVWPGTLPPPFIPLTSSPCPRRHHASEAAKRP
jgi:uncharacterized protein (DUF736 family)